MRYIQKLIYSETLLLTRPIKLKVDAKIPYIKLCSQENPKNEHEIEFPKKGETSRMCSQENFASRWILRTLEVAAPRLL